MIAYRHEHADLIHWAQATRTEIDDLLEAVTDRGTADHEAAVAACGHFEQGFRLVDQALGGTHTGP
ncbi:hypothetical protein ACWFMI_23340 [Nocardiopsis terrae]|uniref:hypothetical protein n=1 Tax=Streptomyces sp. NPDC057554 TaxID=3350538 RepID=UPI0036742EB4